LSDQWEESVTVPMYKEGDKTDCSYYWGISLLSTAYRKLFDILLSRLTLYSYVDEIIRDHQCGFQRDRPTTDKIFCIHQVLEKNESTVGLHISYL
jgi:hypothetical protein